MVPTGRLTEKVLEKRFSILPASLQAAITSDDNLARVAKICSDNHIADTERILIVQQVVSFVLLGFLHPDDITEELNEAPGFDDPKVVNAIVKDLNEKIFSFLGFDLKKNYAPIKITLINKKIATPASTKNSIPVLVNIAGEATQKDLEAVTIENAGTPKIIATTTPSVGVPTSPMPPQNLSGMGWSKMKPIGPAIVSAVLPPTPINAISNSIPKPPTPQKSAVGEFERIKSPITPQASLTPTPIPNPAPAPVILRQEMPAASAAQKNADFHIIKPNDSAQMEFGKGKEQMKIMPAIIEFNKNIPSNTKTPTMPLPPTAPGRTSAVNYTEFKSSLASIPIVNSGARKFTEITSANSIPATLPTPPKPPTPPTPSFNKIPATAMPPVPPTVNKVPLPMPIMQTPTPTSPQPVAKKVIVQDFLEKPLK
jgi:hypothetical protein